MINSIIKLLPEAPYGSIHELIRSRQDLYPKDWCYKPVGIEVEITNKCNIKCAGCGQRDEAMRPKDVMGAREYIRVLHDVAKTPVFACSITGGETLMYLERVKEIIRDTHGVLDIYKLNSNSYRFINDSLTIGVLTQLKDSGFGISNRFIKPVFVTSIGQQNEDGMPLNNSVYLVKNFYSVFDRDKAIVSVNATDKDIGKARSWNNKFRALYKEMTGKEVTEELVPMREFMLNNIPTLQRLGLVIEYNVPIEKLIQSFKTQYTSWRCLNQPTPTDGDLTTLMPKCVLRPNGDLYACPGYNYVHKIGNILNTSFWNILTDANTNPILRIMYTEGLPGLYKYASSIDSAITDEKLSLSHAPCDVCQYLTKKITAVSKK
jgi:hypothetical protein